MILRDKINLHDEFGNGLTGRTVVVYPTSTIANGVAAVEIGLGEYEIILDTTVIAAASIAKFYDIYVGGVLKQTKKSFGEWWWNVTGKEVASDMTLNFADLTDSEGNSLPATMPSNITVALMRKWVDADCYIPSIITTGFTVNISGIIEEGVTPKFDFAIYLP